MKWMEGRKRKKKKRTKVEREIVGSGLPLTAPSTSGQWKRKTVRGREGGR